MLFLFAGMVHKQDAGRPRIRYIRGGQRGHSPFEVNGIQRQPLSLFCAKPRFYKLVEICQCYFSFLLIGRVFLELLAMI